MYFYISLFVILTELSFFINSYGPSCGSKEFLFY